MLLQNKILEGECWLRNWHLVNQYRNSTSLTESENVLVTWYWYVMNRTNVVRILKSYIRKTLSEKYSTNREINLEIYEGWNFNFGNAAVTFDTAHLHSSYFHRPSMYSPKLCRTRSQRWGSRMMPLAAPVLLMARTERSTAEGLNPRCNCPIR